MRYHTFNLGKNIEAGVIQENVLDGLPFNVVTMNQVHGDKVLVIGSESVEKFENNSGHDAIVCFKKGVKIMVKTADCIPIVISSYVDEGSSGGSCGYAAVAAVATVHAGWRSLTQDIIPKTFAKMGGTDFKVGIGPSLGLCCSEFSDPKNEIPEKFHWAIRENNKVDLNAIALRQLEDLGVVKENISHMKICTKCDANWFSFRRNGCKERFGTIIYAHE